MSDLKAGGGLTNFQILTIAVAGSSAFFSLFLWLNARKGMKNQTFVRLLEQYSTPQMLYAVQSLHDLYKKCNHKGIDLRTAFDAICKRETIEYQKASLHDQSMMIEKSINNSRRIVTHFYYRLLSVIKSRVVPKRYIFRYWSVKGLRLIPDVIHRLGLDDDKELDELYIMASKHRTGKASLIVFWILLALFVLISEGVIVYHALSN